MTSRPSSSTRPPLTGASPSTALPTVVLPEPDSPTSATVSHHESEHRLEIRTQDPVSGLRVRTHFEVYGDLPVLRSWSEVSATGRLAGEWDGSGTVAGAAPMLLSGSTGHAVPVEGMG